MARIRLARALAGALCALALTLLPGAARGEEYSFGVIPQFEQRKLFETWQPIVDELQRRTGLTFRLITTLKVPEFEQEFQRGAFDFVYMNPFYVVKTASTLGYLPLVKDEVPMRGVLVVKKGGPIRKVAELEGREVAFPTPNAPAGCMLLRAELKSEGGVAVRPVFVKTASNVFLQVAKGLVVAGGAPDKTFQRQDPALKEQLEIIHTTSPMPPHPIAASPRVSAVVRERVRAALLELAATPAGRELFARIPMQKPVAASLGEYRALSKFRLEDYWDPGWKED